MTTSTGPAARTRRSTGPRRAAVVLLAGALSALGACSDTGEDPTTTTAGPTTTDGATSTTTTAVTSSTTTSPGDVDPQDFEDGAGTASFSTPSGDIGCVLTEEEVRCDVVEAQFDPPPAPADCDLDWGHALIVRREGSGKFLCAGDTVVGSDHVLEEDETLRYGDFSCAYAEWDDEVGVSCSQVAGGQGFRVSVAEYLLY